MINSLAMKPRKKPLALFSTDAAAKLSAQVARLSDLEVERIEKMIARKFPVVIWPKSLKEKDINDMVLAGHDVNDLVESNTYSSLQAQVKLTEWKKV